MQYTVVFNSTSTFIATTIQTSVADSDPVGSGRLGRDPDADLDHSNLHIFTFFVLKTVMNS
jgi:hypothetical protein